MNLVATGIRPAVLLEPGQVCRASPPLADVLVALEELIARGTPADTGAIAVTAEDVASLGVFLLEGSCFLVNRKLLRERLAGTLAPWRPSLDQPDSTHASAVEGGSDVLVEECTRTLEARPSTDAETEVGAMGSVGEDAYSRQRDFAMLDVRKSLPAPAVRTDALLPCLCQALLAIFGEPHDGEGSREMSAARLVADEPGAPVPVDEGSHGGVTSSDGRGWLHDWNRKELAVERHQALWTGCGSVGLPGLAGWLLEYPVIYCLPASEDKEAAGDPGNCLSMVPLTVYSVHIDLETPSSALVADDSHRCHALSFSVPQSLEGDSLTRSHLSRLLDSFASRLRSRFARVVPHSDSRESCQRLRIDTRTEVLDRVAL